MIPPVEIPPVEDTADVGAAVQALHPRLRQQSAVALAVIVLLGLATFAAAFWALSLLDQGSDGFKFATFAVIFGVAAIVFAFRQLRRAQEALVMPAVASAVGLSYEKDAKPFLAALPQRLLPQKTFRTAEDLVHGRLGNHTIRMAEVRVETGGKSSRTLFRGIVAQFPNSLPMPAFFLAPLQQTKPGMIFGARMPTDGLYHLRDVTGPSGVAYGVWTSWTALEEPPALSAVIKVLTDLETQVGVSATLFSATSNGEEIHVALSQSRDLYRIGGMFPDAAQLLSDVHAATRDLSVALNLARQLIAAEEAAAGANAGTS